MEQETTDVEPTTLAGIEVTDVFVDWNVSYSNPPELVVVLDGDVDRDAIMNRCPWVAVGTDEPATKWVTSDDGIYVGFERGESFENRRTYDKMTPWTYVDIRDVDTSGISLDSVSRIVREFEEGETLITGTYMYDHVVRSEIERQLGVEDLLRITTHETYTYSRTTNLRKAEELVEKYVNGPLGSDTVAYWVWKRDRESGGWARATAARSRWEDNDLIDCEVELVPDDIYNYVPSRVER